ncbi:MAG TPA: GGDEF domain-containing protein [Candidatus Dormibacteraeota bacterium]|nr:GGDEF domain-containing protein [Candidatus Dormibacteraeota bacterium]
MSTPSSEQGPKTQFEVINLLLRGLEGALGVAINETARADEQSAYAKRMEEVALLDPLTGLGNRRALEDDYKRLQDGENGSRQNDGRANSNEPVALLLIDVDRFKSINDSYGHAVGDKVLVGVADVMRKSVRQRDSVVRWGGEEFAILLPRASEEKALEKAEDIRQSVTASGLLHEVDPMRELSVSTGLAMVDLSFPLEYTATSADLALYAAKHQGRNQVVLASQLSQTPDFQGVQLVLSEPSQES